MMESSVNQILRKMWVRCEYTCTCKRRNEDHNVGVIDFIRGAYININI